MTDRVLEFVIALTLLDYVIVYIDIDTEMEMEMDIYLYGIQI